MLNLYARNKTNGLVPVSYSLNNVTSFFLPLLTIGEGSDRPTTGFA